METPPRILLVRLSSRGDILLVTPLLRALKQRHPDAVIDFLTREKFADVLRHNRRIRRLHLFPKTRLGVLLRRGRLVACCRELRAFLRELRRERYTHILDLHHVTDSALLALAARGGMRIGHRSQPLTLFFSRRAAFPVANRTAGDHAALLAPGSLDIRRKCCDLRLVRMFASPETPAGQPDPEGDILLGELEWLLGATFDQAGQRELVVKTAQVYLHRQDLARAANMLYLAVEQGPSDLNALYLYAGCLSKMGATDSARQAAAIAHDRIDKMVKSEMLAERKGHEWHEKFKNF